MVSEYLPERQADFNKRFVDGLVFSPKLGPLGLSDSSSKTKVVIASPDNPRSIERGVGLQIIANEASRVSDVEVDVACTPYRNVQSTMECEPLITLFGGRNVSETDILGLSISNPMLFYDSFRFFDLAGIEPLAQKRSDDSRLVVAGGLGVTNPAPLESFVDAFVMGEGDEAIKGIVGKYAHWKETGRDKEHLLEDLSEVPGVYVPSLYSRVREGDELTDILPMSRAPGRVDFQIMNDIDNYRRTSLMTSRNHAFLFLDFSCKYKCTFCQMSNVRGKYFNRGIESIISDLEELDSLGVETVTLASNTSTNFPEEGIAEIFRRASRLQIKPLIRSVRIDRLSDPMFSHILQGYLHIAPETETDRLRNQVLQKGMKNAEIYSNVEKAVELGVNDIRMYAIVGIPSETEEDREELAKLISRVGQTIGRKHASGQVRVDMYPLLPQVGTPFEQTDFIGTNRLFRYFTEINSYVQANVPSHIDAEINSLNPVEHMVEGIANIGDREAGNILYEAYQREEEFGGTLKSLEGVFEERGISYRDVIHIPKYSCPPWKVVQTANQARIERTKAKLGLSLDVIYPEKEALCRK